MSASVRVQTLTVEGKLVWDISKDGLELRAGYILVAEGGELQIGTLQAPMERQATIYITDNDHQHPDLGVRFLGSHGNAQVKIHGRPLARTWTLLSKTAKAGEDQIQVKHDPTSMGWRVGDRIGIATTSRGESVVNRIRDIGPATEYQLDVVGAEAGIEETIDGYSPAGNAADGNEGTFWGSWCAPTCAGTEHWISFELGERCAVKQVRILFDTYRYAPKYHIQTKNNMEEDWATVTTIEDGTGGWAAVPLGSVMARFLRIYAEESGLATRPNRDSYAGVRIREFQAFGTPLNRPLPTVLHLESPLANEHWGGFRTIKGRSFEMAAEVVNLDRSVVITGDHSDFETSRKGLHTIMHGEGLMDVRYARVEYCGQRDILGRYCLHFHHGRTCRDCVFKGNAVVESQQVGITVHNTHSTLVDQNILWDTRAAGIYTEDGNEMQNTLSSNVMICSRSSKCSVPWLANAGSEVAGMYLIGMTNHILYNRMAGWENGLWSHGSKFGTGKGAALNKACPMFTPFLTVRGNVAHDNSRFGLYLDNQRPRKLRRDADGYLLDNADCLEFTADGKDNGVVPANVVEDWFDWHNAFNGQYKLGDIEFRGYISVNNVNNLYWKASKNFADGASMHVRDSVFANDPQDPFGKLEMRGPSGPFTFMMKNVTFLGGPVGAAALNAGQHCGLGGAGGPCNVQYLLEGVDFSGLDSADAQRIGFGIEGRADIMWTPIFLAMDNSLGGHRAMVSRHFDGFGGVRGCSASGAEWGGAWACERAVRRLNIWSTRDLGPLSIKGPGYEVAPNMANPVNSANAGAISFEPMHKGYGVPVFQGERYVLSGAWASDEALELSDERLQSHLGEQAAVDLEMGGSVCSLRSSFSRDFIGPFGMPQGVAVNWECVQQPTPLPTAQQPTPLPTAQQPTPLPTAAPTLGSVLMLSGASPQHGGRGLPHALFLSAGFAAVLAYRLCPRNGV